MNNKITVDIPFNDKAHSSKRLWRFPFFLGLFFSLLTGISPLYSTSWSGSKGDYLNPVFEEYFQKLAQFEWELLAGEVSSEMEQRAGGSLDRLYQLYADDLREVQTSIEQEEMLSPLEKRALWVYAEHIVINQVYSPHYTISLSIDGPRTEEIKQVSMEGQDRIMSLVKDSKFPDDPVLANRPQYQKRLRSFLLSLYAENFFFSINFRDDYNFAHESHTLYKEAFWYDPLNPRAYLGFGHFYTVTANLNPVYAGVADQNYNYVLDHLHNQSAMGDPYNRVLVLNALIGKSQSAITRGSYTAARGYLDRAGEMASSSGFLNYINLIYQKRRTMYTYSQKDLFADEESQSSINFYYNYSIETSDRFLYQNLFNFISRDALYTVFLSIGNNFSPASLLLEEGLTIYLDRWGIDIGAMQNPLFIDGVGSYTGFLGVQLRLTDFYIKLKTQYGVFYDYMPVDSVFRLDNHQAIEATFDWSFFLYHSSRVRLEIEQKNKYRYSFGKGVHTWRSDLELPWTLFDHLWGEVYTLNGVAFAYSSDPTAILNQVEFFGMTPVSLKRLQQKSLELYETPLSGVMLIHHSLFYRFYPLVLMDSYTGAKGLFIAPSFHYGTVFSNLGDINGDRPDTIENSFSVLGSLGYRFPGDMTISLGAGWNDRDGVVLNLLMY